MELATALNGISAKSYFEFCHLHYSGLKHHGFSKMKWHELPPSMQLGMKRLILELYQTQKIVFYYEFEYTLQRLKICGVKYKTFFESCDINASFYSNKYLSQKDYSKSLLRIRLEILKIINRLFDYITSSKTQKNEIQHLCT